MERSAIGICINYRGQVADLDRIEDLEDRVLDLVLDLGGQAQIWRSSADSDPRRVVRGLIINCFPGQDTMSLLISPEGWLVNLTEIEDAEERRLAEPPWCFVKTQFGPLEGHVALVELLAALKREFIPDLEVSDEGEYWETRDFSQLSKKFAFLRAAIDGLAAGLERHGLSREAAEDPEILLSRITRIAEKVRRSLSRPAEHPPVGGADEVDEFAPPAGADEIEAEWDELYKHNRRRQEQIERYLEERLARGEDYETAFEGAMRDAGLDLPEDELDGDEPYDAPDDEVAWSDDEEPDDVEEASEDSDADVFRRAQHPLLERATKFWTRLHDLLNDKNEAARSAVESVSHGAGDLCGGLAQALGEKHFDDDEIDRHLCGLSIVQLKRALRGAAFVRGGLFQLSSTGAITGELCDELRDALRPIEDEAFAELARVRDSLKSDGQ